jgi:2'-5' RNA ligase
MSRVSDMEWESALLLPVPAAEAAVEAHRARLDASARDGVPAHVTVLYPFLPPGEIGPTVLARLATLFAAAPRFSFTLDQVRWFGESVVWLGPSDPEPFRALTGLAAAAYPSCPPYRGIHADVVPHLTIGYCVADDADDDGLDHDGATGERGGRDRVGPAELRAAAEAVRPLLPIAAEATAVILMAGPRPERASEPPDQWRTVASFPLGN